MYFYRATCYGGCRNSADGAGGGVLKPAECRPANWGPAAGVASQHAPMLVGEPEPTPQCQKLPLSMRQSLGASWVKGLGWVEKKTKEQSKYAGEIQVKSSKTDGRSERNRKRSGNRSDPERPVSLHQLVTPVNPHATTAAAEHQAGTWRVILIQLLLFTFVSPTYQWQTIPPLQQLYTMAKGGSKGNCENHLPNLENSYAKALAIAQSAMNAIEAVKNGRRTNYIRASTNHRKARMLLKMFNIRAAGYFHPISSKDFPTWVT